MRNLWLLVLLVSVLPLVAARHDQGCVPTHAAWSDVIVLDLTAQGGSLYYGEERGNPLGTQPPLPLSGFLLGEGSWLWEETNGLAGLQRGGLSLWDQCLPTPIPCLILDPDPINDEHCGHGPDRIMV